jgi:hypothetical protein
MVDDSDARQSITGRRSLELLDASCAAAKARQDPLGPKVPRPHHGILHVLGRETLPEMYRMRTAFHIRSKDEMRQGQWMVRWTFNA